MLQDWFVLPIMAALLVILFMPLYRILKGRLGSMESKVESIETIISDNFSTFRDANGYERMADREEMGNNLRGMSDSVVHIIGEMSRSQQQQLDSFGGQIRAMSRSDEERMDRMRGGVEEKLQEYDKQMERVGKTLENRLESNERRMVDLRQSLSDGLQQIQQSNERKLEQMRVTVDEKLNATLDSRLSESFKSVSDRLEQVHKGLGEMQSLATGVGDLKRVLTNVKTRGIWGEVQLGTLLEQMMAPGQYESNVIVKPGNTERVEFAVCLPGKDEMGRSVYLPIDAKFPMEDYQRLLDATEAGDKEAVETASRMLETTIRTEAKRIRQKYIHPPYTTDFAIMFLPVEGLFAEVLRRNGIVEQLQQESRVVVTGPTTLAAVLNSLQMGFRTLAIEHRSSEVWELLGAVKTEFGRFADLLGKTQQRLHQATASIEDAARKSRTIQRKLQGVQELSDRDAKHMLDMDASENACHNTGDNIGD